MFSNNEREKMAKISAVINSQDKEINSLKTLIAHQADEKFLLEDEVLRLKQSLANLTKRTKQTKVEQTTVTDVFRPVSKFTDEFTVRGILGQGGFGCVFNAENRYDGWEYAVKRIAVGLKKEFHDPRACDYALDGALSEVRAMGQLDHPGIVRYNSMWIEQPPPGWQRNADVQMLNKFGTTTTCLNMNYPSNSIFIYIQMQLCKYSLEQWLADYNTVSSRHLPRMKSWFKQMLFAIAYIHEKNLIHRDLKPSNILFVEEDRIKICDLGIATERKANDGMETEWTRTSTGTVLYMSPEQLSMVPRYSSKTDVFSLGLILAELCVVMTTTERRMIFDNYRRGIACDRIEDKETEKIIAVMTKLEPNDRPSCQELLKRAYPIEEAHTRF